MEVILQVIFFKLSLPIEILNTFYEIGLKWVAQNSTDEIIGSGDGLVPKGNKPLPEPMLTGIYVATWRHEATFVNDCFHTCHLRIPTTHL